MARQLDKFEFIEGIRKSRQVLHNSYLYNKHSGISYRCVTPLFSETLNINEEAMTVSKGPTVHYGHIELTPCRVAVMKAIQKMKDKAFTNTTVAIKEIYEQGHKSLTDAGFKITDIHAPLIGGLLPFARFRGTLSTIRQTAVPPLLLTLDDIDFELPQFKIYTLTNEGEQFLRYDNQKPKQRILIFMSQCSIDWLRESLRNHSDGTFQTAPKFFFSFMYFSVKRMT